MGNEVGFALAMTGLVFTVIVIVLGVWVGDMVPRGRRWWHVLLVSGFGGLAAIFWILAAWSVVWS